MKHIIVLSLISLLSTFAFSHEGHDHSDPRETKKQSTPKVHKGKAKAAHPAIILTEKDIIPSIKINVTKDTHSGWNLQIITENFKFTPESVNKTNRPGEGHAHLYIDGKKVARIYDHWHHISHLKVGMHRIEVTLNTNKHEELIYNSKVIKAKKVVRQNETEKPLSH